MPANSDLPRRNLERMLEQDGRRRQRREVGHGSFWRSLRVLGMVGWPISLSSVGGAWLGRLLDRHFQTGVQFTLLGLFLGVALGSYVAWRSLEPHAGRRS